MQFKEPVVANFLTFQLMGENEVLQINGIYLNDRPALSEIGKIKLTHLKEFASIFILFSRVFYSQQSSDRLFPTK